MQTILTQILQAPDFVENRDWRRREFVENELIIQAGENERKLYLIESGCVRVFSQVELEEGRKIQPGLSDLCQGDVFGELSLFEERPRSASVTALAAGSLVEIDSAALSAYLETHKETGYEVLKLMFNSLIQRLSASNQKVTHLLAWGLKAHHIAEEL